jgi:hypothetical protein
MDVYSHIIEGMQGDAMALLEEVTSLRENRTKKKISTNSRHNGIKNSRFSFKPL